MTRIGYVLKVYPRFSETFVVTEILAREGAALNPEAMHTERVDGLNPLAVADATTRIHSRDILIVSGQVDLIERFAARP